MSCNTLLHQLQRYLLEGTRVLPSEFGCRIELPIYEVNGDAISIYFEERGGKVLIHDGGHISSLLFESGPAGANQGDRQLVLRLLDEAGFALDQNRGIAFVQADDSTLPYWSMELARTIAVMGTRLPNGPIPRRRQRRLGKRVLQDIIKRLGDDRLSQVIQQGRNVQGITQENRWVDLSYTVPSSALRPETSVFILAVDLEVADPLSKANRSIAIAADLSAIEIKPSVRIVHSKGTADDKAARAEKLIEAVAVKDLFRDYSWDNDEEQEKFLEEVRQELAPLLS